MLNTDVELVYDIDVSATEGTSCAVGTDCTEASTKDLVATYATVSSKVCMKDKYYLTIHLFLRILLHGWLISKQFMRK